MYGTVLGMRKTALRKLLWTAAALVLGGLLGLAIPAIAATVSPLPPTNGTPYSSAFFTGWTSNVTLTGNGAACTAPGGASCTTVLDSTYVGQWDNVSVWVKVPGASTATNVLVEASPDGTTWVELSARSMDGITTGTMFVMNIIGHYAYLRVEARAAVDTTAAVALSGYRP